MHVEPARPEYRGVEGVGGRRRTEQDHRGPSPSGYPVELHLVRDRVRVRVRDRVSDRVRARARVRVSEPHQ